MESQGLVGGAEAVDIGRGGFSGGCGLLGGEHCPLPPKKPTGEKRLLCRTCLPNSSSSKGHPGSCPGLKSYPVLEDTLVAEGHWRVFTKCPLPGPLSPHLPLQTGTSPRGLLASPALLMGPLAAL